MANEPVPFERPGGQQPGQWSILEGSFEPDGTFPSEATIADIKSRRDDSSDKESLGRRMYFSELLLYALETTNPGAFTERTQKMKIGNTVSEAASLSLNLESIHRKKDLRAIAGVTISPEEVPVMQAVNKMHETNAISTKERAILYAIIRAIYIRQSKSSREV